jgi:hypothetical protein
MKTALQISFQKNQPLVTLLLKLPKKIGKKLNGPLIILKFCLLRLCRPIECFSKFYFLVIAGIDQLEV